MYTKITLSGEVASGKSTVGKLLAEHLGYEFISIGNKTRERAEKEGLTIVEFQQKCRENPMLDQELDDEFSTYCNNSKNLVIDYRMGFHFIKDAFHIFMKISEKEAMERMITAQRANETYLTVHERNISFKSQFENVYGIDYTNESNYDLIVSANHPTTAEETMEYIFNNLKQFKNGQEE